MNEFLERLTFELLNAESPALFVNERKTMNAQAGLPEALANRQRRVSVSDDATQGLGISRGAHCSIRAARFRLIDANGVETLIPNLYLDVVIIRANPKDSKLYFQGPYNPDSGDPPACYSKSMQWTLQQPLAMHHYSSARQTARLCCRRWPTRRRSLAPTTSGMSIAA